MIADYHKYDTYDINSLKNAGVNIFNIDLTKTEFEYYEKIKDSLVEAQSMPELIKCSYNTPVTLSVTMSVTNPIEIDDRVSAFVKYRTSMRMGCVLLHNRNIASTLMHASTETGSSDWRTYLLMDY